ncbi:MAG TPA: peptidoglycan DD-metalloendopeptidase family protein [Solirubrobacteraceae bacterium]
MRSLLRPYTRAVCALLLAVAVSGAILVAATAHAASPGQLQQQISAGQSHISGLAGALGAASGRLANLNADIASLQTRITRIQADLDAKRAQLLKLRSELDSARTRLAQLQAFEARGEQVLSQQLVSAYENDRPDIISVVLEARGFKDLLERLSFAQRVRNQSVRIVDRVRAARRAVAAQAVRLGALDARQQTITEQVLLQRNALARVRISLVQQQISAAQNRDAKASALASARGHVSALQRQLSKLQAAQAAAAAAAAGASGSSGSGGASVGAGQVSSGGGFTFPLPRGSAVPPGGWTLDQGVDIAAPGGTSLLAVCSGTIVLHGIGGFGPDAPVLHCDSPLAGYSYVYYGHAGPANAVAIGTHVGAGQVISEVGPGIVGFSTGPHLEIGFSDGSGTPVGGGSASAMMSLLRSSYGG